jgi:hypothetical protein
MELMVSTVLCKFCGSVCTFQYSGSFFINKSGQDEFEMDLRLLGAPTIKDVVPSMVDASSIHSHVISVPADNLYDANCAYLRFLLLI